MNLDYVYFSSDFSLSDWLKLSLIHEPRAQKASALESAAAAFCRSNRSQLLCCDFANWQLPPPVPWAFAKCQSGAVHQFKCEINRNESRSQSLAFCYNFRAICCRLCLSVCLSVWLAFCRSTSIAKERGAIAMLKVFTITQRLIEIDFGLIGCWYAHCLEFFSRNGGNRRLCERG